MTVEGSTMAVWNTLLNAVDIWLVLGLGTTALAAAFCSVWVLAAIAPEARRQRRALLDGAATDLVFLFDGEALVDATAGARQLVAAAPDAAGTDWARLMMLLLPRFPDLESRIGALGDDREQEYRSRDQTSRLLAEWRGALTRLTLLDVETADAGREIDRYSLTAMERELETLRQVNEVTPALIWRQTARGQITWANRAYLDMVARIRGDADTALWPPPPLFEAAELMAPVGEAGVRRLALDSGGKGRKRWFDCTSTPAGDEAIFVAVSVDATVHAEGQLREFMQTLTQTFAQLTIGLAIFDRSRHLALFNPALTDLTQLPFEFLASRPTLFGFLDRLREKKMIPEPRDYSGWRKKLLELEAAAEHGTYAETWSLPSGQTYRVMGRPHPDGAVAFLFENISAEISLTRQFRSELEMGQAVLDSLDEAIAVFSADGVLTMTNKAYIALWGVDPGTSLKDIGITEAMRTWLDRSVPSPVWGDIRDFADRVRDRTTWQAQVRLQDGGALACRVVPLAAGATLIGFRRTQERFAPAGRTALAGA
ncbi:PAS-domain containing protein [Roseitranquillus sediminis]|uniref:PAS-domain containing protein n=1 Tax=Roseitranquillus sediminis TaxID=2809051 RepID=UPI001D0C13BC|nr:PAS-domain containing protein [Roseitranquillus sediminis]MBM9596257.1 PAS-domain containing protein [Roseitranquillus sediminis]